MLVLLLLKYILFKVTLLLLEFSSLVLFSLLSWTDALHTGLTVSGLMGTLRIKASEMPDFPAHIFIVTFLSDLLHQILQEDGDVSRADTGLLHWTVVACLALLMERFGLDDALSVRQAHVEDNHCLVGSPDSPTFGASEPCTGAPDTHLPALVWVFWSNTLIKLQAPVVSIFKNLRFIFKDPGPI